jgi:hypothetical protein
MIDKTVQKIILIMLSLQLTAILKNNTTRYIIREWFSKGELTAMQFITKNIFSLSMKQFLGLGIIACFTMITFPLGIWLGSFKMGWSYPVTNMITSTLNLVTFPITLYTMNKVLNEMEFNNKTWLGVGLIVVSKLLLIVGCWFMYRGNVK